MVRVSVVVPTYNERESLPLLVNALRDVMGNETDWELIVVDDDSPDETWKVAEDMASKDRRIRIYRRLDCRGLSSAVVAGLSMAGGERVVVMDADLQHDVPGCLNWWRLWTILRWRWERVTHRAGA